MPCPACLTVIWTFITGLVVALVHKITKKSSKPTVDPALLRDHYWSNEPDRTDQTVRDFKIDTSDDVLNDLKDRLSKGRIFNSLPGTNFTYGMRSETLQDIVNYWLNDFDWRRVESELNQLPHFKTTIEGLDIHFVHIKAKQPTRQTLPIILVHGWPGSFVEYVKSIPFLENDFNLVIPSIPGYGFSQAPEKPGCSATHVARIFCKLMKRLGYSKFVYHGGDWGSIIGTKIASMYPNEVLGAHITLPTATRSLGHIIKLGLAHYVPNLVYTESNIIPEQKMTLGSYIKFAWNELGYAHIQATKPDTVGYALNDSPTGLAAYILEKFSTWTNPEYLNRSDGGLYERFTLDELLTNVMIYWINGNITSSVRLYRETLVSALMDKHYVTIPMGISPGRHELMNHSPSFLTGTYPNLIHYNNQLNGGHFLFFEMPQEATDDLKTFIGKLRLVR